MAQHDLYGDLAARMLKKSSQASNVSMALSLTGADVGVNGEGKEKPQQIARGAR